MNYGEKLSKCMRDANLDIKTLSDKTGITQFVLTRYLENNRIPKASDLIKISNECGVTVTDLIGD